MSLHYPKSFRRLLAVGCAVVALPLVVALVSNALSVDQLLKQSVGAVRTAVQFTNSGRALGETITAMERNARQTMVLEEVELGDDYARLRAELTRTVRQLQKLPLTDPQRQQLADFVHREQRLFELLRQSVVERDASVAEITAGFAQLVRLGEALAAGSGERIESEILELDREAQRTQRLVLWQLLAAIPAALLFIVAFVAFTVRPIRQLAGAIRQLGDGEFHRPIAVKGPRDLEHLGQLLDWLRERLVDVEEQKSRFLRHVSHELKTPLAALWDGSEMLADGVAGELNAKQREIVHILQGSNRQLRRLIENLLDFSALQSSPKPIEFRPVRLREVVRAVVGDNQLGIAAKQLVVRDRCANLTVHGDAARLRLIADNLLSNAIKFAPIASTIEIGLAQQGGDALLEVIDDGPGIPETDRERVFDAFYQSTASASGAIKGSGLGLSIVKEHVTAHRGRVEVLRFAPQGAHLRVRLPVHHDDSPP